MNFFNNLFNKKKHFIECPRCLGKGHVDQDDIKRLGQELKWRTGRCAYCTGTGKADVEMIDKVAVDEAYLTTGLSERERTLFINGNPDAIDRGEMTVERMNLFIEEITELHFVRKLDVERIALFYLESLPALSAEEYAEEKSALVKYIQKVIAVNK